MPRGINQHNEIKCITPTGEIKWFSEMIVNDALLMKERGFRVVDVPEKLEAKIIEQPTANIEAEVIAEETTVKTKTK